MRITVSAMARRTGRDPQVQLERRQRERERLGEGTRSQSWPVGARADGRDGTGLEEPQSADGVDRPLDVLRLAEGGRGPCLQPRQPSPGPLVERRTGITIGADDPASPGELEPAALDGATHELPRPAGHGGDDPAIPSSGDRIDAEGDASEHRVEVALHEHRHRPSLGGLDDPSEGLGERAPAAHVDDAGELSGSR